MPARRVIVTRPAREAARWVEALRQRGLDAVALPLIEIAPAADGEMLRAARGGIDRHAALMFVSAAAVEHFFLTFEPPSGFTTRTRFWATGPGTAQALIAVGVPPTAIDVPPPDAPQFDSEALWQCVQPQARAGTRVLIVRGGDGAGQAVGRDWLARRLEAAGAAVETVVAYRRLPPTFDAGERELANEGARGTAIWLFSSSEAIGNLCRACPGQDWRGARAVATHARIAQTAQEAGFGLVIASSPTVAAVVASIELQP
ncbi:MAG: uroporphyrinogen-III synthase [Burkholderiaceae bacterium]